MIKRLDKEIKTMLHDGKHIEAIYHAGKCYFNAILLTSNTKYIIKDAYGEQVLKDVNDYLRALPDKGVALSEFINQDPHLAASISPNSTKIRTATIRNKSVDNHLYNGLILPTPFSQVGKMEMTIQAEHNNTMILSGATSDTTMSGYYSFGGTNSLGAGTITRTGTWSLNELVSVGLDFVANTKSQNIRICGWTNSSWNYDLIIESWDIYDTAGDLRYQLVPFVTAEGEVCFLNLVDCTLQHNVYTDPFTIAITDKE